MAAFESNDEERTESPSQFRREEFRRQGTVALSKELLSIAGLFAVGLALMGMGSIVQQQFGGLATTFFKVSSQEMTKGALLDLRAPVLKSLGWMVLPVFFVVALAGITACLAQVGFYFTTEPLSPKWERIDPIAGFQRLFSSQGAVEAVKAIIKLTIAGVVIWIFLKGQIGVMGNILGKDISENSSFLLDTVGKLFFSLIASLAAVAAGDYLFQRFRLEKQLKMTRREAKEEFKLREGDPLIKQRIRTIQRRMASRRMMESVPKADVIVTNPTHLAVALKFDAATMAAPRVTAKGAGVIAQKIREVAKKNNVPIVENKPLARTLYKELDIGQSIPRELYKAVAEVLAYVYRLRGAQRAAYA